MVVGREDASGARQEQAGGARASSSGTRARRAASRETHDHSAIRAAGGAERHRAAQQHRRRPLAGARTECRRRRRRRGWRPRRPRTVRKRRLRTTRRDTRTRCEAQQHTRACKSGSAHSAGKNEWAARMRERTGARTGYRGVPGARGRDGGGRGRTAKRQQGRGEASAEHSRNKKTSRRRRCRRVFTLTGREFGVWETARRRELAWQLAQEAKDWSTDVRRNLPEGSAEAESGIPRHGKTA